MKIEFKKEPFEHFIIEDLYTKEELNDIWAESKFIYSYSDDTSNRDETGTAINRYGAPMAKRKSIFYDRMFAVEFMRSKLKTYNHSRKIYNNPEITESGTIGPMIINTNQDGMLINFYNDGDYYETHKDDAAFTFLSYHWEGKKDFIGGVLRFDNYDYTFDPKNNSAIIFPSCMSHSLNTVSSLNKTDTELKRMSIAVFLGLAVYK